MRNRALVGWVRVGHCHGSSFDRTVWVMPGDGLGSSCLGRKQDYNGEGERGLGVLG